VRGRGQQLLTTCRDATTVGQQLSGVLEQHDPIAKEAPPLLGVRDDDVCGVAVELRGRGARRSVRAHVRRWGGWCSDHLFVVPRNRLQVVLATSSVLRVSQMSSISNI